VNRICSAGFEALSFLSQKITSRIHFLKLKVTDERLSLPPAEGVHIRTSGDTRDDPSNGLSNVAEICNPLPPQDQADDFHGSPGGGGGW
jgi:hypothetical protein